MIYLDTSNTWFLRQDVSSGLLECVPQDEADLGADWEPFLGTQEDFDGFIRCQAPMDRVPPHLHEN